MRFRMRLKLPLLMLGLAAFAATPAMAQNNASANPYYNTNTGTQNYYSASPTGGIPVYNNMNNTPTLPMQQMIAGKNAPSYNYNTGGVKPYDFGTGSNNAYSGQAAMSAEQQAQLYQQQLLNQQAYQQQLAAQQQQQQQYANGQNGMSDPNNYNNLTQFANSPFGTNTQQNVPRQRKVIYKDLNNPLKDPPRLFNPDQ